MTLYCAHCQRGQVVGEELRACQRCGSHFFTTAKPVRPGLLAWTVDDRRFLRSLRIQADDDRIEEAPA